jgi:ribosomal protein S12 methylthiotransferase
LKISEGCNHTCSFCIIPSMRGKLKSRASNDVLFEAERLVKAGVKELLVISQDTSAYGLDLKHAESQWRERSVKARLTEMCDAMGSLGAWVRLHYVYPYPHVDEIIPLMADGKLLPYLDIPFQHAEPRVLKAMRRPGNQVKLLQRLKSWREICPDIAIRSTFIVGFPGETEADFDFLLDWMQEAQLDRVGCFKYENVEGAAARDLPDQVPDDVKQLRWERFMAAQQKISAAKLKAKVGRTFDVLVDEAKRTTAVGRTYADAPEIDGIVKIKDAAGVQVGDMIKVKIEKADAYDLTGRRVA